MIGNIQTSSSEQLIHRIQNQNVTLTRTRSLPNLGSSSRLKSLISDSETNSSSDVSNSSSSFTYLDAKSVNLMSEPVNSSKSLAFLSTYEAVAVSGTPREHQPIELEHITTHDGRSFVSCLSSVVLDINNMGDSKTLPNLGSSFGLRWKSFRNDDSTLISTLSRTSNVAPNSDRISRTRPSIPTIITIPHN